MPPAASRFPTGALRHTTHVFLFIWKVQRILGWYAALFTLFLASTLCTSAAPVLDADDPESEFIISHWYGEGGLPHNVITKVHRDSQGFLWLGTEGGLARFDGRFFVTYAIPEEFVRGRFSIRALASDNDGTITAIAGSGQVVRLRDGKFEAHPVNSYTYQPTQTALDLAIDDSGGLWLGTDVRSVIRWGKEGVREFDLKQQTGDQLSAHYCFVSDANGRTWISAGDFLGWYESGKIQRYDLDAEHAIMIGKAHAGGIWVASRESLSKIENGTRKVVLAGAQWPVAQYGIQDLYEATDGVLWLATRRNGVFRLIDGQLKQLPAVQRTESIAEDNDGNIWLGANGGGLVRLKSKHYLLLNKASGMPTNISSSVTQDETGAFWFANQSGGVVRLKDGEISVSNEGNGENVFATNVCADQRGHVWVGTLNGLYVIDSKPSDGAYKLNRIAENISSVQTLFCAPNGDVWIGWSTSWMNSRSQRIGRIRQGQLRVFGEKDGLVSRRIAGIAERHGPDGPELWIGMQSGQLFKAVGNGERFEEIALPADVLPALTYALHVDAKNRFWLATSRGILLWDENKPLLFTKKNGLPDDVIYQVISGNHGMLWASSRQGIFHVPIEQLIASTTSPDKQATAVLFGHDDQLDGLSGMIGGQPMTWKDNEGRLWFATYRGMVGFEGQSSTNSNVTLAAYVDGLSVDGSWLKISKDKATLITPGAKQIEFSFAGLNFSTPGRTMVRRILEGFDVDWVDATGEQSCSYSRLPPGHYTFRIQVTDSGNLAHEAQASVKIEVIAAWWQTRFFQVGLLLVIAAAGAWGVRKASNRILRRRVRRLEQERTLERERARIARNLHDELGSRISQIGFVADRVYRQTSQPSQKEMLGRLVAQARSLVEDLHRIVWTVNPQNDSWQKLAAYISRYAQRQLHDTGILCTVDGVDAIPDLPIAPEARDNILAIAKESLTNMLKHSQADHVTIKLMASNGIFHMRICDNGKGFDVAGTSQKDGYGLKNMQARIAELSGVISINSEIEKGTEILVDIPLHHGQIQARQRPSASNPRNSTHDHLSRDS